MTMFPSKHQWKKWSLPSKLTALGAYVGIVGVLLGAFSLLPVVLKHQDEVEDKGVKVVDVTAIDDLPAISEFRQQWLQGGVSDGGSSDGFPLVDVKLRNTGRTTAFLKSVDLEATRVSYERHGFSGCLPMGPSWNYNVLLDADKLVQRLRISISQVLKANDADRFVISIGHGGTGALAEYKVRLALNYNENDHVALGQLDMRVFGPDCHPLRRLPALRRLPEPASNYGSRPAP